MCRTGSGGETVHWERGERGHVPVEPFGQQYGHLCVVQLRLLNALSSGHRVVLVYGCPPFIK